MRIGKAVQMETHVTVQQAHHGGGVVSLAINTSRTDGWGPGRTDTRMDIPLTPDECDSLAVILRGEAAKVRADNPQPQPVPAPRGDYAQGPQVAYAPAAKPKLGEAYPPNPHDQQVIASLQAQLADANGKIAALREALEVGQFAVKEAAAAVKDAMGKKRKR